jgi:hypothetical protein
MWKQASIAVCGVCGHEWLPRESDPKRCARCKRPNWDQAKGKPDPPERLKRDVQEVLDQAKKAKPPKQKVERPPKPLLPTVNPLHKPRCTCILCGLVRAGH